MSTHRFRSWTSKLFLLGVFISSTAISIQGASPDKSMKVMKHWGNHNPLSVLVVLNQDNGEMFYLEGPNKGLQYNPDKRETVTDGTSIVSSSSLKKVNTNNVKRAQSINIDRKNKKVSFRLDGKYHALELKEKANMKTAKITNPHESLKTDEVLDSNSETNVVAEAAMLEFATILVNVERSKKANKNN